MKKHYELPRQTPGAPSYLQNVKDALERADKKQKGLYEPQTGFLEKMISGAGKIANKYLNVRTGAAAAVGLYMLSMAPSALSNDVKKAPVKPAASQEVTYTKEELKQLGVGSVEELRKYEQAEQHSIKAADKQPEPSLKEKPGIQVESVYKNDTPAYKTVETKKADGMIYETVRVKRGDTISQLAFQGHKKYFPENSEARKYSSLKKDFEKVKKANTFIDNINLIYPGQEIEFCYDKDGLCGITYEAKDIQRMKKRAAAKKEKAPAKKTQARESLEETAQKPLTKIETPKAPAQVEEKAKPKYTGSDYRKVKKLADRNRLRLARLAYEMSNEYGEDFAAENGMIDKNIDIYTGISEKLGNKDEKTMDRISHDFRNIRQVPLKQGLEEKVAAPAAAGGESEPMLYVKEQAKQWKGIKHEDNALYDRSTLEGRFKENNDNAGANMKTAGRGLMGTIVGIAELPGKVLNGITWGLIPDYCLDCEESKVGSKPGEGAWNKVMYPFKKVIGDGAGDVINPAVDTVKGAAFGAWNVSAQNILDASIGSAGDAGRKISNGLNNGILLTADWATNCIPASDASMRVHAMDPEQGAAGLPIINNAMNIDEHTVELADGSQGTVSNTTFRKSIETVGSLFGDWLLYEMMKGDSDGNGGSSRQPLPDEPMGIGGGQGVGQGAN